jgi:hypothetical protein
MKLKYIVVFLVLLLLGYFLWDGRPKTIWQEVYNEKPPYYSKIEKLYH